MRIEAVEVFQTWQHSQFTTQTLYISLLSDLQPCSDMSHPPSPSLKPWTFLGPSQHMALHRGVCVSWLLRGQILPCATTGLLLYTPGPALGLCRVWVPQSTSTVCLQLHGVPVNPWSMSQNTASPLSLCKSLISWASILSWAQSASSCILASKTWLVSHPSQLSCSCKIWHQGQQNLAPHMRPHMNIVPGPGQTGHHQTGIETETNWKGLQKPQIKPDWDAWHSALGKIKRVDLHGLAEQHNPTVIAWAQRMMRNCTLVQGTGIRGNEATPV